MKGFSYIQFPNCLLMETYQEDIESGLRLILRYGLMHYASKLKYDIQEVARQTAYYYYRKKEILQSSITDRIKEAISKKQFTIDEDHEGFQGQGSESSQNIQELTRLFDIDPGFRDECILHYQIHLATSDNQLSVRVASNDSIIESFRSAEHIKQDFENKFGPDAFPSCKTDMIFDFIRDPGEIDLFRAYIGILSLIGQRKFISTSKPVILSRMLGCKSKAAFEYYSGNPLFRETVLKYSKRYQMDKLLMSLAEKKFIMYLARKHESIVYVSRYMEPDDLAGMINSNRESNGLRRKQREALELLNTKLNTN